MLKSYLSCVTNLIILFRPCRFVFKDLKKSNCTFKRIHLERPFPEQHCVARTPVSEGPLLQERLENVYPDKSTRVVYILNTKSTSACY